MRREELPGSASLPADRNPAAQSHLPVVAHIMPWSGIGGVEIATIRLVKNTQAHFRHVAFLLEDALDLRRLFLELGIPVRIYRPPTSSIRHGLLYWRESQAVAALLQRDRVQIVHFADMKAAEHSSLAALIARTRQICHVRVSMPKVTLRNKLCYLPVERFLFVSQEARRSFGFARARRRARVIYDAVTPAGEVDPFRPEALRAELNIVPGRPVVGTVARVSAQKDYRTLAAAAVVVLAQRPETHFLIVGDNSRVELNRKHFEEISTELVELGIRDSFLFTGHREDVPDLIRLMDFCVLSTHREGFPLTLLEIMAEGKPVIATAVGGIPEIVHQGVNGFLFPHRDASALAGHILHLLNNPSEVLRMGETAQQIVLRDFSPQHFADEIVSLYRELL